jgi:hypothetical protein
MNPIPVPREQIDLVERARLGYVATVTPAGEPHVSPKGTAWLLDGGQQLGFAHIHSHRTVRNLDQNPALVLSVVDVFQRRGLIVHGRARVHGLDTEAYGRLAAAYGDRRGSVPTGVHAFVVADITGWEPVLSPAYDDGAGVVAVEARWRKFYASQYSAPAA